MAKEILILDFDDTIVEGDFLKIANECFGRNYTKQDLTHYYVEDNYSGVTKAQKKLFYDELAKRNLYERATMIEGAYTTLYQLAKDYELVIFSACVLKNREQDSGKLFADKYQYILKHFDFIKPNNIILGGNKSILHGKAFMDDRLENLEGCHVKYKLLFSSYHNQNISDNHLLNRGIVRIKDYNHYYRFITHQLTKEEMDNTIKKYLQFHGMRNIHFRYQIAKDMMGISFYSKTHDNLKYGNVFYKNLERLLGMKVFNLLIFGN